MTLTYRPPSHLHCRESDYKVITIRVGDVEPPDVARRLGWWADVAIVTVLTEHGPRGPTAEEIAEVEGMNADIAREYWEWGVVP